MLHLKHLLRPTALLLLLLGLMSAFTAQSCCEEKAEPAPACDPNLTPVIFIHGFLASGDTYADQIMRFDANLYCDQNLRAFDWNTLAGAGAAVPKLDSLVDEILSTTGAAKVNLVGHSAGGGLSYAYLADASRAAKVARYVHIGSGFQSGPAGPAGEIPTLNIYSTDDRTVPGGDIPGATNKQFTGFDHYQVATAPEVFTEIFAFFNDNKVPQTTDIVPESEIELSGRVLTLGENAPKAGATIEIYEVGNSDGQRLSATPNVVLNSDAKGYWGPWKAKADTRYEFFVRTGTPGDRPIHYYREGFKRSNPAVYLRTFPAPNTFAGILLAGVPANDNQSVLAVFSASRAVIDQRDMLSVNGFSLSSPTLTPAQKTIIAMFLYDGGDGQSSGNVHTSFQLLQSFLTGVDYFTPTVEPASIKLEFNGRNLFVPNWKSQTDGVSVAVFD